MIVKSSFIIKKYQKKLGVFKALSPGASIFRL